MSIKLSLPAGQEKQVVLLGPNYLELKDTTLATLETQNLEEFFSYLGRFKKEETLVFYNVNGLNVKAYPTEVNYHTQPIAECSQ